MTKLEERLRRDLRALAEQAQPGLLRELRVPQARPAWRQRRWLIPVAAAAAVAAVLGGVYAVRSPARPAVAAAVPSVPRYYLENSTGRELGVRVSGTGRVVSSLAAPAGYFFGFIAGAGDGRTFVVAVVPAREGHRSVTTFRLLRVSAAGQLTERSRLHFTVAAGRAGYSVTGLAVSPDDRLLAVAMATGRNAAQAASPGPARLAEVLLPAGTEVRSWTEPGEVQPDQLAWAGPRKLSFTSIDPVSRARPHAVAQLRLLDMSAASPGGNLLTASQAVRFSTPAGSMLISAQVTPGGRDVVAWTSGPQHLAGGAQVQTLGEYDSRTGRLLAILYGGPRGRDRLAGAGPFVIDRSGQHLLIEAWTLYGALIFGRVDNGHFTSLPHPATSDTGVLAAW
jgi:hypothetical protein